MVPIHLGFPYNKVLPAATQRQAHRLLQILREKSKADSPCWLRAISGSLAVPGTLQTIHLSRKHGLDGHVYFQNLVGREEDEDGSLPPLQ
ncbi:hypothetical protein VTO73DRAFT_12961 [Trametes versicolor]